MKSRSTNLILALIVLSTTLSMNAAQDSSAASQSSEVIKKLKIAYATQIKCSNDKECYDFVDGYIVNFEYSTFRLSHKEKFSESKNVEKIYTQGAVPGIEATIKGEIIVNDKSIRDISLPETHLILKCMKEGTTYKYKSSGKVCDECIKLYKIKGLETSDAAKAAQLYRNNRMSEDAVIDIECTELSVTPVVE